METLRPAGRAQDARTFAGPLPSIADVIDLPAARVGRPEVVAAARNIDRAVRWLHVSELSDIAELLRGGELILTTGIALPDSADELERYVERLSGAGASGLVLEYGRRFTSAPKALIRACSRHGLPLVVLHRQLEFMRLTEAVHSRILERQMASLQTSERAHQVFTTLTVGGADFAEIVSATARLAGGAVVLEDSMRRAVACDAADLSLDALLNRWEARSRAARSTQRTAICGPEEWAVTAVEVNGEVLGRLILLSPLRPTQEQVAILERAAVALTMKRLLARNLEPLHLQAQRSVLADLIEGRFTDDSDVLTRSAAIGVQLNRRVFVAVIVEAVSPGGPPAGRTRELVNRLADAARAAGTPVLLSSWSDGTVGALVPFEDPEQRRPVLTRLAVELRSRCTEELSIAAGSSVTRLRDVRRSFVEANSVAHIPSRSDDTPYRELPRTGLRALVYTFGGDPRLHAFVTRTLDPLLTYDADHESDLLSTLTAYLECYGNKSRAARVSCLSRTALYQRLELIERVLKVDLTSGEVCTALHAALMAHDAETTAARSAAAAADRHLSLGLPVSADLGEWRGREISL